jgi:succinate dehydrogenase/fumarate reductase cytochrome b subunit
MNLSVRRAAATNLNAGARALRCLPSAAALLYPLALLLLYEFGRQFVQASDLTGKLATGILLGIAIGLVYGVPALSFAVIVRSADDIRARRIAHLAFAAPPLFVVIGVVFYMLNVPNGDYLAWGIVWLGVLGLAAFAAPSSEVSAAAPSWIRAAHGCSAAAIIVIFLALHLANHLTAAWSLETNKRMMDLLRVWYRSDLVQPALVALFVFQLLSGLRLLWAKIPQTTDVYSSIQTATGAYLLVYITSHLIAVFILGRIFLGVDTTFAWASGAPTGLLLDPWNVRLIPHYSLASLFILSHLAVGLRAVVLAHGVRVAPANHLAWIICGVGLGVSLVITIGQLSVHA